MAPEVFAMVLGAALLHAAWNALVKVNTDRLIMVGIMMTSQIAIATMALPFVAFPTPQAWPFIFYSTALHTAYFSFLVLAYRYGDLSHVYPIARGVAPLIVAVVSVVIVGEVLSYPAMLAVVAVALGIMSLSLTRSAYGLGESKAILYALGTGVFIAGYTIVDGLGARHAASAHSYIFWLNIFDGIPITILALYLRWGQVLTEVRRSWKPGVLAGIVSLLAYWIVLWAMTLAPLAMVSAVRETSMVFAVLFGVIFLKEKLNTARLISISITLFGVVFLKIS